MKRKLHFNKPQLKSMIVGAPVEVLVAGRGTGKSEGVLAPKTAKCYLGTMPRSAGVAVGATYNQLLTRTLPALVAGWERLGYVMGEHFLIGRRPTDQWIKQWNWKGPFRPPLDFKYFISWWNGAGIHLVSQDRTGSSNGITIDWIFGDEAKLLNAEKLKTELFPANRGIIPEFNGNPYHHGITFTTDMPTSTKGNWIFEYEKQMDTQKVKQIIAIQTVLQKLRPIAAGTKKTAAKEALRQIAILNQELADLRKNLVLYHEASTLENIHALGVDYIKQQLRDTTIAQFDAQILNRRPMKAEEGFYPDFDEEVHGYFANNNSYLEKLNYDFSAISTINCLRDSDLDANKPLHIALDYNRRIHPMVVGQEKGNNIQVINGLHSLFPNKLKEVVQQFIDYYKPHHRKLVYYWYDHTAVGDDNETRKCDEVINMLRKAGWVVVPMYLGQQPGHEVRYRMWGHILQSDGTHSKTVTFNRENCSSLIIAINRCGVVNNRDEGFKKDKKPEHDNNYPAEEAPHYTDALDTLVYGMTVSGLRYNSSERSVSSIITK